MSYAVVDEKYCKGCLRCMSVCTKDCLQLSGLTNGGGYDYVEFKEGAPCIGCLLCRTVCPDVAITVHKDN